MVNIHGKEYITVAERIETAHKDGAFEELTTDVLNDNPVVIKATVTIKGKKYTGISAANPLKAIEKQSPYEVAETSAVGRALGFAGFGIVGGITSADEVIKAESPDNNDFQENIPYKCSVCGTNVKTAHKPGCPNENK